MHVSSEGIYTLLCVGSSCEAIPQEIGKWFSKVEEGGRVLLYVRLPPRDRYGAWDPNALLGLLGYIIGEGERCYYYRVEDKYVRIHRDEDGKITIRVGDEKVLGEWEREVEDASKDSMNRVLWIRREGKPIMTIP